MASEKKRGPVALRLGLSPGLPLSRYEFSAYAMRRQFWDVPKFGLGLSLGVHKIGASGLGSGAAIQLNGRNDSRIASYLARTRQLTYCVL
jgi:hypothetical protein